MKPPVHLRPAHRVVAALLLASAALAGCVPAHRQAPALASITAPPDWSTPHSSQAPVNPQWWQAFGDATLNQHVEAALGHNTDLLAAGSRLDAARAQLALSRSAIGPTLSGTLGVQAQRALGATGVATTRVVQPGLQASWEPDLWGRLQTLVSAADFRLRASQADRDAVALSISSTTVQTYIGLLALEAQLAQTRDTATSRAEALRIARDKAQAGYTSQLQVTQAESEYQSVLQSLPQLQAAIARQYNALRLLTGELPGQRDPADAQPQRFTQLRLPSVPVALPSELLRRRPDLAQAESLLAASDASLQASRAAFLPQVSLSASLGALYINALGYNPASLWSIGGSVLAPLFDQGRRPPNTTAPPPSATKPRLPIAAPRWQRLPMWKTPWSAWSGCNSKWTTPRSAATFWRTRCNMPKTATKPATRPIWNSSMPSATSTRPRSKSSTCASRSC